MFILSLSACAGTEPGEEKPAALVNHFYAPAPGTVVAVDSMKIEEDELNKLYYSAIITANDNSDEGYYDLDASYGFNKAHSQLRYPMLDKEIIPAIRRDETMPYSYIIGFRFRGEPQFKDYARVSAQRTGLHKWQIELRYMVSYYMDSVETK